MILWNTDSAKAKEYLSKDKRLLSNVRIAKTRFSFLFLQTWTQSPECASVFGVDNKKGVNFKNGEKLAIGNYDLKELKKFEV